MRSSGHSREIPNTSRKTVHGLAVAAAIVTAGVFAVAVVEKNRAALEWSVPISIVALLLQLPGNLAASIGLNGWVAANGNLNPEGVIGVYGGVALLLFFAARKSAGDDTLVITRRLVVVGFWMLLLPELLPILMASLDFGFEKPLIGLAILVLVSTPVPPYPSTTWARFFSSVNSVAALVVLAAGIFWLVWVP